MASDHTRTAILTAAERLYAERGFADVTLRDIVAAAGVNLAAVNYHFGSKDELIAELFVTRSLATNRERLNELKIAEAAGGGRADIEDVLRAHPNVADVAVLGVPDNEWGEKVAAVVVVKNGQPTTEELAAFVKARLRSSKTPEVWEFREALPCNDTGKLLRRVLKAELTKSAGALASA